MSSDSHDRSRIHDEIRLHHSRRLCRRAAGVARRQDAAAGRRTCRPWTPSPRPASSAGPTTCPPRLPAGSDVANLSLLGLRPARVLHRPRAAGGRRPGHRAGPGRLGHSLQSGDDRRPDDARLHGRPHLDRRSHASCWPPLQEQLGGEQLEFMPGVSYRNLLIYRGGSGRPPFSRRHAHHAAARSDRQVGARRLSARPGQRPA